MKENLSCLDQVTNGFSAKSLNRLSMLSVVLLLMSSVLWSDPVFAGKLDDFEKSAKKPTKKSKPHRSHRDDDDSFFDLFFEDLFSSVIEVLAKGVIDGLYGGLEQLSTSPDLRGMPANWSMSLQGARHSFDDDISGKQIELFTQRNNWGFHWQKLWMKEEPIDDTLVLSNWHIMAQTDNRASQFGIASPLTLGMGIGGATLTGNQSDTGLSAILTLQYTMTPATRFKFNQTINWLEPGARMSDSSMGFEIYADKVVVGAGYHWLKAQGDVIHGPMLSIGVVW